MEFPLCAVCILRHEKNKSALRASTPEACHICGGAFLQYGALADSALAMAKGNKFEWETFGVTTTIARKMLVKEEDLFDNGIDGMSAKNQLNRLIAEYVEKKAGKKSAVQNPDMKISIDFSRQKSTATPANVFLFAHYLKSTRKYCQHLWVCGKCNGRGCNACAGHGENYPSIEGAIKGIFGPAFGASDVMLHASGREDVDVMMEGNGRPCVIEIVHPAKRNADFAALANALSSAHPIQLVGIKKCFPSWVESVCTSHFEKEYVVWVDAGREVSRDELEKLAAMAPLLLLQRTPMRVSHRRADLVRRRFVREIEILSHEKNLFTLRLATDAGTYIKEFVHSDEGRTVPSLTSIFGSSCTCKQLNVAGIHDDFVSTLGEIG